MRRVTVREIRRLLPEIEAALRAEGELIVTKRGRPIARLTAVEPTATRRPSNADLRALADANGILSEDLVRADRDARE